MIVIFLLGMLNFSFAGEFTGASVVLNQNNVDVDKLLDAGYNIENMKLSDPRAARVEIKDVLIFVTQDSIYFKEDLNGIRMIRTTRPNGRANRVNGPTISLISEFQKDRHVVKRQDVYGVVYRRPER